MSRALLLLWLLVLSCSSCIPLSSGCLSYALGLFLFPCQDKKYASDKYKDIYTELSIVKAKADCDISRLKEQLKAATEAQGEKSPVNTTVSGYGQCSSSRSEPSLGSWFSACILVSEPLCRTWSEHRALRGAFFAISRWIPPLLLVETSLGQQEVGSPSTPSPPPPSFQPQERKLVDLKTLLPPPTRRALC